MVEGSDFRIEFCEFLPFCLVSFTLHTEISAEQTVYIVEFPESGDVQFINKVSIDTGIGKHASPQKTTASASLASTSWSVTSPPSCFS